MSEKYLNLFWGYILLAIIAFFFKMILFLFAEHSHIVRNIIVVLQVLFNFKTFVTVSIFLIVFSISTDPLPLRLLKKLVKLHKNRNHSYIMETKIDKGSDSYLDKF